MSFKLLRSPLSGCLVAACVSLSTLPGFADEGTNEGWINSISKNASVQMGAGTRMSARVNEDSDRTGNQWSNNFNLDNIRLYFGAQVFDYLGVTLNTDINNAQGFETAGNGYEDAGEIRIVDAIARFEFHDLFNVWAGRFLPPSDRSNLDGPYYLTAWDFPYVQFGYPNIFQGRDDGIAVWGQAGEGRQNGDWFGTHFKWQLGVFEGADGGGAAGTTNPDDSMLYTGRLVLNLLDPEKGYYNSSTYHGTKDVLAFGAVYMYQEDATLGATSDHDFRGHSFDFLYERNLGDDVGVVTLEAAYYDFDDESRKTDSLMTAGSAPTRQGESYFYLLGYLLPWEVGVGPVSGKMQPFFRYLDYRHANKAPGAAGYFEEGIDIGVNYILKGHDARLAVVYQRRDRGLGAGHLDTLLFGTQLQF